MTYQELKNKKFNINSIRIFDFSIFYIYISIFIFIIGWIKTIYAIPICMIIGILIYNFRKTYKQKIKNLKPIYISLPMLLTVIFTVVIVGIILGWTGAFSQTADWIKHNATLSDLTNKQWPVYYQNNNEYSMLTYYLGQYMVPSLIGKIFANNFITQLINGLWAMFGLIIAILNIYKITKSDTKEKQLIALIIIFLFASCVVLSKYIGKIIIPGKISNNNNWLIAINDYKLQFSSNITLLRWVMPQVITTWISLSLLYENKEEIKYYILLGLPLVFYSTFPFLALFIMMIILALVKLFKNKKVKNWFKEVFSIPNIICFFTLGVVLIAYFAGNIISKKPSNISFQFINYKNNILIYILFILSFIPYTLLLFKNNKKNTLFWCATILLLILPFGKLGLYNDLVMRTSIPCLYIYMILCINELFNFKKQKFKTIILGIFLLVGFFNSMQELSYTSNIKPNTRFDSLEKYANRTLNINNDLKYNYYTYDLDKNFFYNHLARKKLP